MLSHLLQIGTYALFLATHANAQDPSDSGYVGYNLTLKGDQDSVIYSTENTRPDVSIAYSDADVYLNASVQVGEIDIRVDNLTAKVNLDLQVLKLLQFNAGVEVSIDQVQLLIENVTAKVLLEARLENLVAMVNRTLNSLDLNSTIATLGQTAGEAVDSTVGDLTGGNNSSSDALLKRSYELENNILYSVNDYSGNKHTNRVLAQNGDLVDESLNNNGDPQGRRIVGHYEDDMTFTGHEANVVRDGEGITVLEYEYSPYHGISAICAIYLDSAGSVIATRVLSESFVGGTSTIGEL
ncbi:hypothetical protein LTR70_003782 [Exophiala xenobiotica]|uniref:Uncharacterized protein n=1 Tax=Lithohypha guttulata TaxID=1690604 RepID=A0ABR0KF71_9EURO|nr:hypothetical protein LTR24_003351 [Lithohypha guttulata]KAK5322281.1 hypothetical protein LTR70_003782 [Exophiala xenobiotica]